MKVIVALLLFAIGAHSYPLLDHRFLYPFSDPLGRYVFPFHDIERRVDPFVRLMPRRLEFPRVPLSRELFDEVHVPEVDFIPRFEERDSLLERILDPYMRHPILPRIDEHFLDHAPIVVETRKFIIELPERVVTPVTEVRKDDRVVTPITEERVVVSTPVPVVELKAEHRIPEVRTEVPEIRREVPEVRIAVPEVRREVPEVRLGEPEVRVSVPELMTVRPETVSQVQLTA